MPNHTVASRAEHEAARLELLDAEKQLTRLLDDVARRRRALPWVPVETDYVFTSDAGPRTLTDLFDGRGQLIVWHFMFGDDWEEGCPSCSFWADGYDGMVPHLAARDVALVAVSTAPVDRLLAYRERMGWSFPWVSSGGTTFNRDFEVAGSSRYNYRATAEPIGESPGFSTFVRSDGQVFHTYSAYARGLDIFNNAYQMLDAVARGRDEDDLPWSMAWLRRHDQYDAPSDE
jgi:predicted dithiol-disulfide oxidoreductase (DUF899 family)